MKLPDELDTGGKWELVFHRLQIAEEDWHQKYSRKRWGDGSCRQKKSVIPVIMIRFI